MTNKISCMTKTFQSDLGVCPSCGRPMTGHTALTRRDPTPRAPQPGDLSLCAHCRVYLMITDRGVRLLTNAEWFALSPHERADLARMRETAPRLP